MTYKSIIHKLDSENVETKLHILTVGVSVSDQNMIIAALGSNYELETINSIDQALDSIKHKLPNIIILDLCVSNDRVKKNLKDLTSLKHLHPNVIVITLTSKENSSISMRSLIMGAYDYIEKPLSIPKLNPMLKKAIHFHAKQSGSHDIEHDNEFLIGKSNPVTILKGLILKLSPTSSRILISGAPGLGKEVIARIIHQRSKMQKKPFIVLRASSIPKDKIHETMFGIEQHDNNSFIKPGILENACHGTLYIDEVSELNSTMQNILINLLQTNKFYRIGGHNAVNFNSRIISASSKNLYNEVENGKLREDLYHRLNIVNITAPPLSERVNDLPDLCQFLIKKISIGLGVPYRSISKNAIIAMQSYSWPKNIRQLRNILESIMLMDYGSTEPIQVNDLPPEITSDAPFIFHKIEHKSDIISMPIKRARQEFEKQYLSAQISRFNGNISKTANFIGMERSALHRKLKTLKLVRG